MDAEQQQPSKEGGQPHSDRQDLVLAPLKRVRFDAGPDHRGRT